MWLKISTGILGAALIARTGSAAVEPMARPAPARVIWVHPERVPAERRAGLTRLLADALDGRAPPRSGVRDSRPRIQAGSALFR
jgi:hypothetical protein